MFDFISYVRDTGIEITILPPREGVLICLEVRELEHNYYERCEIRDDQAKRCGNIDAYTGQVIDAMVARIGKKKAEEYSRKHGSRQLRERERFFRNE